MKTVQLPSVKAASASSGSFASYVKADLGGAKQKLAFRVSLAETAITQALQGNYDNWTGAAAFATEKANGKKPSALSLAYAEAFQAVGTVVRIPYIGKLSAPENKDVRIAIAEQGRTLSEAFRIAFENALTVIKDEAAATKAAAPADQGEATAEADSQGEGEAAPASDTEADTDTASDTVATICDLLRVGALSAEQISMIRAALPAKVKQAA
jgi:hypothetical protein